MEKRLVIAVVLSILVILSWSAFMPKQPVPRGTTTQSDAQLVPSPAPVSIQLKETEVIDKSPGKLISVDEDQYVLTFNETTAAVEDVVFKLYKDHKFSLRTGFALLGEKLIFRQDKKGQPVISFVQSDVYKTIKKVFILHKSNYTIELDITVQNTSNNALPVQYPLSLGILDFKSDPAAARFRDIAVGTTNNGLLRTQFYNGRKDLLVDNPRFVAIRDQYFCNIVEPQFENCSLAIKKISQHETEVSLLPKEVVLSPGQIWKEKFLIYLGPEDLHIIKAIDPAWGSVVNYGFFDFISRLLLQLLEFFYKIVHNWGWAIIILSIAVYLILFPLTMKQMRSMKEMQALQPRIEELRKLYKDNPQKLHKATLELYREHKVNPFGGCLPLLLQMPIFFALYQALIRSIVLKGASFFWIKDLAAPDRLFMLPVQLPIIGNEFNILPILMAIVMFLQQKMSMGNTKSEYAEQQKIMLVVMPVLFGLIFYHMPSGLVLYWFVNSVLMMANQLRMNMAK